MQKPTPLTGRSRGQRPKKIANPLESPLLLLAVDGWCRQGLLLFNPERSRVRIPPGSLLYGAGSSVAERFVPLPLLPPSTFHLPSAAVVWNRLTSRESKKPFRFFPAVFFASESPMTTLNRIVALFTHEGAKAPRIAPLAQLERSVMSCLLWEDEFYEGGVTIAARIAGLVRQLPPPTWRRSQSAPRKRCACGMCRC